MTSTFGNLHFGFIRMNEYVDGLAKVIFKYLNPNLVQSP